MNIEKIKKNISEMLGKTVVVKINGGRNKVEIIEGKINAIYPYLFTVKVINEVKSFSYADILTKNVIIKKV